MNDPYGLTRFAEAQTRVYTRVVDELRAGRKWSHWVWYIFPQIDGLGSSETAKKYAITGLDEGGAYEEHPTLGPRLRECAELVVAVEGRTAEEVFGYPDFLKFRSCMTLLDRSSTDRGIFTQALVKYYAGEPDWFTLDILERQRH